MTISVILAHPHEGSFNHAIAEIVVGTLRNSRHQVVFHDLYKEGFDPILPFEEIQKTTKPDSDIQQHCDEIAQADGIVVIHPNWWGQPPAILKGWIDRVLRPGVAYEFLEGDSGEGVPCGLLKAKTALVFNTSNTPEDRELSVFGDPLETIWKNCIFGLCGVKNFYRKMFAVVVTSSEEQRKQWLREVESIVKEFFKGRKLHMNKKEVFEFLNAYPTFHLATVEDGRPHVRGMLLFRADENGIIFHTGKMKDLHKQLTKNPNVEMSFNNGSDGSLENLMQIRVSGAVELVEDIELKKEIVEKREFLKPFVEQAGYEPLAVYRLRKGMASVWTMKTNLAPKEFIEL